MKLIKCHICRLDPNTCNQKCVDMDDVSKLYRDGMSEKDAIPKRFCTEHYCEYNSAGFRCKLGKCIKNGWN